MQVVGSETYDRRLILPVGVTLLGEYGTGSIKVLSFRFYDSVTERRSILTDVPYPLNDPYSHNAIETMIGEAFESWVKEVRVQGKRKLMNQEQKKEVGKILKEMTVNKNKRSESTNNKIYYEGTKNDRKKLNREIRRGSTNTK